MSCIGNLETLRDYEKAMNGEYLKMYDSCYDGLFYNDTALIVPPRMPATQLSRYCYARAFFGCINLQTAPELPALETFSGCYQGMFSGCLFLKSPPKLPAKNAASNCYRNMFTDCKNLERVTQLPATTLESSCYENMFMNSRYSLPGNIQIYEDYSSEHPYEFRIPQSGDKMNTSGTSFIDGMFFNTGGDIENLNFFTTYYVKFPPV